MGYLELSSMLGALPDFSKAVISLWFRVPTATFTYMSGTPSSSSDPNRQSDHMDSSYYYPPLFRIIPLITFGSIEIDDFGNSAQPSFIGIDTLFDGLNSLACNLQTPVRGSVTSVNGSTGPNRPGCFYMTGWTFGPGQPTNNYCAPDKWHHILISFDIGGSQSANYDNAGGAHPYVFTSDSSFTWALDDKNKTDVSMGPSGDNWQPYGLTDPKAVITNWLIDGVGFAGEPGPVPPFQPGDYATFSGGYIKSGTVGIPSSTNFTSNIVNVELAELQFFTGVQTDMTITSNRRLFVSSSGKPVSAGVAQSAFGKAPDIYLGGSSKNWISGKNQGTAGNFTPFGTIVDYTPGPTLA